MAGLYPTNKTVQLNGQKTLYPGVDATGKYTSGDFNDPLVPPSRLDAETLNLVIDNLNSLIESMGLEPNNTNTEQLATLFSSAAIANRGIKRDSAGRAKVSAPQATDDIARKAEVDAEANTRTTATTALSTRIASNDNDISSLSSRISSNDTDIASNNSRISSNNSRISSNYSRITNLQNYRNYETNTGKTWINGQAIYRQCWEGVSKNDAIIFTTSSSAKPVFIATETDTSTEGWVNNYPDRYGNYFTIKMLNGIARIWSSGSLVSRQSSVIVEYTK